MLNMDYTLFYISNTLISRARLKFAKNQVNLSNALRLNFFYLKVIHILHQHYSKEIEYILKNKQKKTSVSIFIRYNAINPNENENEK